MLLKLMERDLIGYANEPPDIAWPNGARVLWLYVKRVSIVTFDETLIPVAISQ